MTMREFIDLLMAAAPESEWDAIEVDFDTSVGTFPSGEEGAEDWIMSTSFLGVEIQEQPAWRDRPAQKFLVIGVSYD
jgi:hypothetical protein